MKEERKEVTVYKVKMFCDCGGELEFVWYCKKPPPQDIKSQRELLEWISVNSKN